MLQKLLFWILLIKLAATGKIIHSSDLLIPQSLCGNVNPGAETILQTHPNRDEAIVKTACFAQPAAFIISLSRKNPFSARRPANISEATFAAWDKYGNLIVAQPGSVMTRMILRNISADGMTHWISELDITPIVWMGRFDGNNNLVLVTFSVITAGQLAYYAKISTDGQILWRKTEDDFRAVFVATSVALQHLDFVAMEDGTTVCLVQDSRGNGYLILVFPNGQLKRSGSVSFPNDKDGKLVLKDGSSFYIKEFISGLTVLSLWSPQNNESWTRSSTMRITECPYVQYLYTLNNETLSICASANPPYVTYRLYPSDTSMSPVQYTLPSLNTYIGLELYSPFLKFVIQRVVCVKGIVLDGFTFVARKNYWLLINLSDKITDVEEQPETTALPLPTNNSSTPVKDAAIFSDAVLIILAVIGGVICLVVLGLLVWHRLKLRARHSKLTAETSQRNLAISSRSTLTSSFLNSASDKLKESLPKDAYLEAHLSKGNMTLTTHTLRGAQVFAIPGFLELKTDLVIRRNRLIAQGGSGAVYQVDFIVKDLQDKFKTSTAIAKEFFETDNLVRLQKAFVQEVCCMYYFHSRYPKYFVELFGFDLSKRMVVMRYYELGSLSRFLHKKSGINRVKLRDILHDVSSGLRCMHIDGFAHCDLKSDNVLLTVDPDSSPRIRAILADLGISKVVDTQTVQSPKGMEIVQIRGMSVRYAAPEVFVNFRQPSAHNSRNDIALKPADVYALNMYRQGPSTAMKRLLTEYRQLTRHAPEGILAGPISEESLFEWRAFISGPEGTAYEGGVFGATLSFPRDYPLSPPVMRFTTPMYHPNLYGDGKVCISILHPAGEDPNQYESSSERWSPVQSVEKILLSVVSLLAEPNDESPANVEAAKLWRSDRNEFNRLVDQTVRQSLGLTDS